MNKRIKTKNTKQYYVDARVRFVSTGVNRKEAIELLESQLQGLNTIHYEIEESQLLVPQYNLEEEGGKCLDCESLASCPYKNKVQGVEYENQK